MEGQDGPKSVSGALQELKDQHAREVERQVQELSEVDQELGGIREAITNLEKQLETLTKFRDDLKAKQESGASVDEGKAYTAIFGVLSSQAQHLAARSVAVAKATAERDAAQEASLEDPETKKLFDEYTTFKTTIEPSLANMPESYRVALMGAHTALEGRLEERLAHLATGPVAVEGDPVSMDVVFAIDAPEGAAEIAMLILPVRDQVTTDWLEKGDTVELTVAARALEALYRACHDLGYGHAQAMFGGFQGLLAVELELPGGDPKPWVDALQNHLTAVLSNSPELKAAGVLAAPALVPADQLFPPEDDAEETEA
jgi:flagellar biosynthesis chaperone FliJ